MKLGTRPVRCHEKLAYDGRQVPAPPFTQGIGLSEVSIKRQMWPSHTLRNKHRKPVGRHDSVSTQLLEDLRGYHINLRSVSHGTLPGPTSFVFSDICSVKSRERTGTY